MYGLRHPSMADTLGSSSQKGNVSVDCEYSNKCPTFWMWTQRTCTDFPDRSRSGTRWCAKPPGSPSIISVGVPCPPGGRPGPEMGGSELGSARHFLVCGTPRTEPSGLVCTLWQLSSLSTIGGSRSFAFFNITIFIAFNLLLFRFNLLIKTNKI